MHASVKCVTSLSKKLSPFYNFPQNSQNFIFYNYVIGTLAFENEVFGLVALITNVNFQ